MNMSNILLFILGVFTAGSLVGIIWSRAKKAGFSKQENRELEGILEDDSSLKKIEESITSNSQAETPKRLFLKFTTKDPHAFAKEDYELGYESYIRSIPVESEYHASCMAKK